MNRTLETGRNAVEGFEVATHSPPRRLAWPVGLIVQQMKFSFAAILKRRQSILENADTRRVTLSAIIFWDRA
jgi:hypothetical protein